MDFKFDLSDPIGMIKQGLDGLAESRKTAMNDRLDILARFEKRAAWKDDDWTYWDFETAPQERAILDNQGLSRRQVEQRCEDWIARDAATKTPLIHLIETGNSDGLVDRVRALVDEGADPNAATLLKDTPLAYARYHGHDAVFDLLIALGANGERVGFSALHHAVRYGTLAEVAPLIETFDILWSSLDANSVLQEAVTAEKPDIIAALLDHVSKQDRLAEAEVYLSCSMAASTGNFALLLPFIERGVQADIALDATLEKFDTQMLRTLLKHGADVHQISDILMYHNEPLLVSDADGQPAIKGYIRALLKAGWSVDDLEEFERDQIRYVTEAYSIPPQDTDAPGFLDPAERCAGTANPEERTRPYYLEMLRTGESAYSARQRMPGLPRAVWTADRFGQSTTRLPDGRWVQIGGEHEDSYDMDFVIFSDVVVHGPNQDVRVYFYPASVFPPTDFHTASLIGDAIWIIGGLGYMGDRLDGITPIYRLDLNDFSMSRIETSGEAPGWISRHTSVVDGTKILVSGGKVSNKGQYRKSSSAYQFDTQSSTWSPQS